MDFEVVISQPAIEDLQSIVSYIAAHNSNAALRMGNELIRRTGILPRHTQPEKELQVLLDQMKLILPEQPPPRITASGKLVE